MSCGIETEANALMSSLLAGEDTAIPVINMSSWDIPLGDSNPALTVVSDLTNDELTTGTVNGTGTFDVLMKSVKAHLLEEFKNNRISGAEYVRAYIELTGAAMTNATQYALSKKQAYWQGVTSQAQLIASRVQIGIAKTQYVNQKFEALTAKAGYALTKAKLSTESSAYCISQYNLNSMLPQQLSLLVQQTATATNQVTLIKEQMEAQRAQTHNSRSDGSTVTGLIGTQKSLYNQQIDSYTRDAELKAAKLFSDAWITQKTIDEGLVPPNSFANASVDTVMNKIKINNGLN